MSVLVCVKCEREMKCMKNDFAVEEMGGDQSIRLKFGDLWECPSCGVKIVSGISPLPFAENYQSDYAEKVAQLKAKGLVVKSR